MRGAGATHAYLGARRLAAQGVESGKRVTAHSKVEAATGRAQAEEGARQCSSGRSGCVKLELVEGVEGAFADLASDGQSLSALEERLPMSRFGVMKHLRVLEEANLVVTRRRGREKLHFLNPVPIRLVYERWVSKYAEPWVSGLTALKRELEEEDVA